MDLTNPQIQLIDPQFRKMKERMLGALQNFSVLVRSQPTQAESNILALAVGFAVREEILASSSPPRMREIVTALDLVDRNIIMGQTTP